MKRTRPPFRADHVGSLLRPMPIRDARAQLAAGTIEPAALTAIEDREIEKLIRKQEEIGLEAITDGECRRSWWHYDFLVGLDGVEWKQIGEGIKFHGAQLRSEQPVVTGKVGFSNHPFLDHFKFVKQHTRKGMPKLTIPSPSALHFRNGREGVPASIYPRMEDFYRDLGQAYRKGVRAFADAGCRYLQLDEVYLIYLVDPALRKVITDRGEDADALPQVYADLVNDAMSDIPADMAITMHLCRGNFKSSFMATGGYEPIAELLFNTINVHGYFMEFDDARSGGFEPLRFVPRDKTVVLGVVTSKTGKLETKDFIKRRIDEATKYINVDQLCLSPQCGFASTEEGNTLSFDEQWAKLEFVREVAEEVWG